MQLFILGVLCLVFMALILMAVLLNILSIQRPPPRTQCVIGLDTHVHVLIAATVAVCVRAHARVCLVTSAAAAHREDRSAPYARHRLHSPRGLAPIHEKRSMSCQCYPGRTLGRQRQQCCCLLTYAREKEKAKWAGCVCGGGVTKRGSQQTRIAASEYQSDGDSAKGETGRGEGARGGWRGNRMTKRGAPRQILTARAEPRALGGDLGTGSERRGAVGVPDRVRPDGISDTAITHHTVQLDQTCLKLLLLLLHHMASELERERALSVRVHVLPSWIKSCSKSTHTPFSPAVQSPPL